MAAFKRLFGGGIQNHLLRNPLLHQVFGISPEESQPGGGNSRGATSGRKSSAVAKGRDAERRNERAHKSASRMSNLAVSDP